MPLIRIDTVKRFARIRFGYPGRKESFWVKGIQSSIGTTLFPASGDGAPIVVSNETIVYPEGGQVATVDEP